MVIVCNNVVRARGGRCACACVCVGGHNKEQPAASSSSSSSSSRTAVINIARHAVLHPCIQFIVLHGSTAALSYSNKVNIPTAKA